MVVRARVRFEAEDIWDAPDNGTRYEVIDGELFMSPPPVSRTIGWRTPAPARWRPTA